MRDSKLSFCRALMRCLIYEVTIRPDVKLGKKIGNDTFGTEASCMTEARSPACTHSQHMLRHRQPRVSIFNCPPGRYYTNSVLRVSPAGRAFLLLFIGWAKRCGPLLHSLRKKLWPLCPIVEPRSCNATDRCPKREASRTWRLA